MSEGNVTKKLESVKLDEAIVRRVRKNKKDFGIEIGRFFEIAAEEKLDKERRLRDALNV